MTVFTTTLTATINQTTETSARAPLHSAAQQRRPASHDLPLLPNSGQPLPDGL